MLQTYDDFLKTNLRDPRFARAYHELDLPSQISAQIVSLRSEQGWTQRILAEKTGTTQSSIARLENMDSLPSLSFLQRIAEALGAKLEIRFTIE